MAEENNAPKRAKKLDKNIEESVVTIACADGTQGTMSFDFNTLPEDIKTKFGPFGLGHKLGDAAAGKQGPEAEEAIQKVWEGLMNGDWSVKAPQGPRVSVKALAEKVGALDPASQEQAKALLTSLGVKIPGFND